VHQDLEFGLLAQRRRQAQSQHRFGIGNEDAKLWEGIGAVHVTGRA
jgi:hypothetical protein